MQMQMPTKREWFLLVIAGLVAVAVILATADNSKEQTSSNEQASRAKVAFNRQPHQMRSGGEILLCAESTNPRLSEKAQFRSNVGSWSRTSRSSYRPRNSGMVNGEVTFIPVKTSPRCRFYRAPEVPVGSKPYAAFLELVVKGKVEQEIQVTILHSQP